MAKSDNLTVAELARRWRRTMPHIYNLVRSGRLSAQKQQGEWRILLKSVEDYERVRLRRG